MPAFTASQASVTNNSKVVQINSGESIANVNSGDFLVLAGFIVEINRAYLGAEGKGYFELVKKWPNSNQANQECIVIPTTGEFKKAVEALSNANVLVNDNFKALQDWQTKTGTVTFSNQDGTTSTVKTLKQIENEAQAQLDEYHPYPWAMRKVEFEARRAENLEKFEASGFVHFGNVLDSSVISEVGRGLQVTEETNPSSLAGLIGLGFEGSSIAGDSELNVSEINIAGVKVKLSTSQNANSYGIKIKLPFLERGLRTYNTVTAESFVHASSAVAFASETDSNKVVTSRHDMQGIEMFLREINDNDPFVYKYGAIQSEASYVDGIPTVDDNIRAASYFAWFEGDIETRGKGVNWQTATETQRIAIASNPDNNIYFDDATGKFYQWCIRGRSFAGIGNGDWINIDSENLYLGFGTDARVKVQGTSEDDGAFDKGTVNQFRGYKSTGNKYPHKGVFTQHENEAGKAVNGQCFFLVLGTTERLNEGAYHPSFNPLGARAWNRRDGGGNTPFYLYKDFNGLPGEMSRITAFQNGRESAINGIGYAPNSGYITSTGLPKSGRVDSRLFDAVYSSGRGGICRDMRYSANPLSNEDFAKADLSIKSNKYRGREVLTTPLKTNIQPPTSSYYIYFDNQLKPDISLNNALGQIVYLRVTANSGVTFSDSYSALGDGSWHRMVVQDVNGRPTLIFEGVSQNIGLLVNGTAANLRVDILLTGSSCGYLHPFNSISVAGKFEVLEVLGDPNNIFLCDDLKDGWIGYFNSKIPNGENETYTFSRLVNEGFTRWGSTNDGGENWNIVANEPSGWNVVTNSRLTSKSTSNVYVYYYNTDASPVEPVMLSEIYELSNGIGKVWASNSRFNEFGRAFGFSLTNKIFTESSTAGEISATHEIKKYSLRLDGYLDQNTYRPTLHESINLKYATGGCGVKALDCKSSENLKGFISYNFTELKHNGVDWGDDQNVNFANYHTTMPDENGNTVLVGTARCVEPLGWIKNDK